MEWSLEWSLESVLKWSLESILNSILPIYNNTKQTQKRRNELKNSWRSSLLSSNIDDPWLNILLLFRFGRRLTYIGYCALYLYPNLYNNTSSKAIVNAAFNITCRLLIEADDRGCCTLIIWPIFGTRLISFT
jgi:hypothetical protein